jgi:predicted RNA methylase/rubredoxin
MTDKTQQMDLMPEASSDASGPVECLGQTFPNDMARRDHYLTRLQAALEELNARLGGVTWTTVDDAVTRLSSLEHWQLGDADRLSELAERMREAGRGQGRGKDLLQLWKDEVGFPHGELDDILRLSDPPYYTACPNPFIGEFIAFYGKPYDPATSDYRREPFAADVSEGKTDPIYNAHSYHTKVPHKAIMHYVLHYTDPGDIVFDGFAGTGMAGIAAQLCGSKESVESLGYRVDNTGAIYQQVEDGTRKSWVPISRIGGRRVVLNDLSPAATFIAYNYTSPVDVGAFERTAKRILRRIDEECGWMYETAHPDNKTKGRINYTVWSEVFSCGVCGKDIVFLDEAFDQESRSVREDFPCPHCGAQSNKNNMNLRYESVFDTALGTAVMRPMRVPALINYTVRGNKYEKKPDDNDLTVLQRIAALPFPTHLPSLEIPDMQMQRVGRMQPTKITHIHHFFLPRAAQTLATIWRLTLDYPDKRIRNMLLFTFEQAIWGLSVLNRYSPSHFSQVNRALSGVFYVPSQISEVSPWYNLDGKLKRLVRAFASLQITEPEAAISTGNVAAFSVSPNSIDYIFTDPPFGENIYYSDLNILVESWHRVRTAPQTEAIVDRVKEKTLLDYQHMMTECFRNYYRILKPGRWMTVEFHNSKNSVWSAIQEALQSAGFIIADVRTLDKKQSSFQQVNSGSAVKQDLVISAYKPNGGLEDRFRLEAGTENGVWDFVRTHLRQLPVFVSKDGQVEVIAERQNYLLFDRMVAFHVQRGVTVPLSASEFYAGLEQRFSERDGMYFLPEQVAEYDKKRMTATEVMQLTLFVTDEASAIQWLKQQLTKKPQTFQDLHPQFMRQIGGWSKHEMSLELRDLLEQNFLVYDGAGEVPSQIHSYLSSAYREMRNLAKDDPRLRGEAADRWYVPDPNKAGDLEKLRERALLREFAEYRESKARKLKVFRLEAVRAGFKKAWGDRDYATILAVAEKIPDAVLQEDPKLLMWYDQALTRSGK